MEFLLEDTKKMDAPPKEHFQNRSIITYLKLESNKKLNV